VHQYITAAAVKQITLQLQNRQSAGKQQGYFQPYQIWLST